MGKKTDFEIFGYTIEAGTTKHISIPTPSLYSHASSDLAVYVRHAKTKGPVVLITAAIHGDEVNGVEIVRRLFKSKKSKLQKGTLIAIPVMNPYGFVTLSRYLPDRRDLNRSFPGNPTGSLARRICYLITNDILPHIDYLIDLHTGAVHRGNLPQVRTNIAHKKSLAMAKWFAPPVIIDSSSRDGSLRETAVSMNIPVLVYESGEALRLDETSIRYGINGILNVLNHLGMIPLREREENPQSVKIAKSSFWIRAPISGMLSLKKKLGDAVKTNEVLGRISDPFLANEVKLTSNHDGIIIGKNNLPLINEGDALLHVASLKQIKDIPEEENIYHPDFMY